MGSGSVLQFMKCTLWTVIFLYMFCGSCQAKRAEYPCPGTDAIKWVRDPNDCSVYFICHYGQPLAMPRCPVGQIWGNQAKNCVPEGSRWDDCKGPKYSLRPKKEEIVIKTQAPVTPISKSESKFITMRAMSTDSYVTSYNIPDMPKSTPKSVRPSYTVTGAVKFTVPVTRPSYHERVTKPPRKTSPFTPGPIRRRHRPTSTPKLFTTRRHTKITSRPRGRGSPFTPSPTTARMILYTTKSPDTPKIPVRPRRPVRPNTTRRWIRPTTTSRYAKSTTRRYIRPTTTKPFVPSTIKYIRPKKIRNKVKQTTTKPVKTTQRYIRPKSTKSARPTTARYLRPTTSRFFRATPPPTTKNTPILKTRITVPPTKRTPFTPWPTRKSRRQTTKYVPPTTVPSTMKSTRSWLKHTRDPSRVRKIEQILQGHPCRTNHGKLLAHPKNCHWYYNCTETALIPKWKQGEPFVAECRYPQLFDIRTGQCREFINVRCGNTFEPVDPCEYRANQCDRANCIPCDKRFGKCRGKPSGIYPFHTDRWTPIFVTCYDQRNIAQDDCQEPTPIFSPEVYDCVSLFEVPKMNGGLRPDCSFREDGYYPDEQGRCGIFFECRDGDFEGYDECPAGKVFDPVTLKCQSLSVAAPPCGRGQLPHCYDRDDGFHADPFGRCTYYFECRRKKFIRYKTCDFGSFDPVKQECVIPTELVPRPCGLLPNPCERKPSGFHPDANSGCKNYIECSRGILISNGTCPANQVFSSVSGKCDRQENAAEPCGLTPSCAKKKDGKYSALLKGCSFYYECVNRKFTGFKQCSYSKGGFFFNEKTGSCDFPQNICPPCGYKWWGCSQSGSLR